MTTAKENKLLKIKEVMEILSCSRTFVYTLLDRGLLKSRKIGNARRILESSVMEVINNE